MKKITTIITLSIVLLTSCTGVIKGFEWQLGKNMANGFYNSGVGIPIILGLFVFIIILAIFGSINNKKIAKEKKIEENLKRKNLINYINEQKILFKSNNIYVPNWGEIDSLANNGEDIDFIDTKIKKAISLAYSEGIRQNNNIKKYGEEKGKKINNKEFFIGMSQDELYDSIGKPTTYEKEVLKTKTKEILIYGNKSSGDVFIFENGVLKTFKDR